MLSQWCSRSDGSGQRQRQLGWGRAGRFMRRRPFLARHRQTIARRRDIVFCRAGRRCGALLKAAYPSAKPQDIVGAIRESAKAPAPSAPRVINVAAALAQLLNTPPASGLWSLVGGVATAGLSPRSICPSIAVSGPPIECCLLVFVVFGTR